jgi:arsenite methyltransferase
VSATDYGSAELAAAYDELSEPQFTHGSELLRLLDIRRSDHVLDIGCGTGRLAMAALERVGDDGRVAGIDPAAPRIAIARAHGDPRLDFRIGDAGDLSAFADASFDVVYLNSVLNWIRDRGRALREARRVLKPRGRLGIATTVSDRPNQLHLLARRAWKLARGVDEPSDAERGTRARRRGATEAQVRSLIEAAGFTPRILEVRTFASVFQDAGRVLEFLLATTYGRLAPGAGPVDYAAMAPALTKLLERDYQQAITPEGIRLERYVLLAIADKPA